MKRALIMLLGLLCWRIVACRSGHATDVSPPTTNASFQVSGVLKEIKPDGKSALIQHDAISNYMAAMTMIFRVKDTNEWLGLKPGDPLSFRLSVTDDESWIDHVKKRGDTIPFVSKPALPPTRGTVTGEHPLMTYQFTNEFGNAVTLESFRGNALAITFFFTRCPIPEYCPRLSRNFEEASQKLLANPNAPTNWHFLSVSIDPEMDTPAVLRGYGRRYHYDSNHWSFVTGPVAKIRELARESGVTYEPENGLLNHNFRTLIIDPLGRMQTSFPIGGNLSDMLVGEIVKAAGNTNR